MIIKENLPISKFAWIRTLKGNGRVKKFYEPNTLQELINLCKGFYEKGLDFDLIGHTSNTLYTPDYVCERMVSTRKVRNYEIKEDCIECECGTPIRQLSLAAIENGIKGFEGLVDLPGTVAAALYGHATCFNCDISALLEEATILNQDGKMQIVKPEWFAFGCRSSALKRKEKKAIILKIKFKKEEGNRDELKMISDYNHARRRATQPEAKNSLGSIFVGSHKPTILNWSLSAITKIYGLFLNLIGKSPNEVAKRKKHLFFTFLGACDVEPYIPYWNWYQWKDERSHELFWKYYKLHQRLFKSSDFEIEIKRN